MARMNAAAKYLASFIVLCSVCLLVIAKFVHVPSKDVSIAMDSLAGAQFVQGMNGAENILVNRDGSRFYVTDLQGFIHLVKENSHGQYALEESRKLGRYALGLGWVNGNDDGIYVAASAKDWLHPGSSIYRLSADLGQAHPLSGDYPGLNGVATDSDGNLYIATGNFGFMKPKGSVIRVGIAEEDAVIANAKSGNGLYYCERDDSLYFSEVFSGISKYDLREKKLSKVIGKSKTIEGFDDFCIDSQCNIWIADPPSGFIKRYDPKSRVMTRIRISGLGVASSCRVSNRNGKEYLYITEIRKENSKEYDGRGVLVVSIDEVLKRI